MRDKKAIFTASAKAQQAVEYLSPGQLTRCFLTCPLLAEDLNTLTTMHDSERSDRRPQMHALASNWKIEI